MSDFQDIAQRHAEQIKEAAHASLPPEEKRRRELWTALEGHVKRAAWAKARLIEASQQGSVQFGEAASYRQAEAESISSLVNLIEFEAGLL